MASEWTPEGELFGLDQPSFGSSFGEAVDLSGDVAIVGANSAEIDGREDQGAAWIFRREGESWVEEVMLTASDGAENNFFGFSVAIDGDRAVVGAIAAGEETAQGGVYYFRRVGGEWLEVATVRGADVDEQDRFGWSLDLEGDRMVVGARTGGPGTSTGGTAYYFELVAGEWIERQKFTETGGGGGHSFGDAVELAGDTLIIGDGAHPGAAGGNAGAAYVFTFDGSAWVEEQRLEAAAPSGAAFFGRALALDGDTLAVGAHQHFSGNNNAQGAAYVFRRKTGVWTEEQELLASDAANDGHFYGKAVAVKGNQVLVAGESDNGTQNKRGIVYEYRFQGDEWVEVGTFRGVTGQGLDEFGESLSIDGVRLIVGHGGNVSVTPWGRAWVYRLPIFSDGFESGDTSAWSVTVP